MQSPKDLFLIGPQLNAGNRRDTPDIRGKGKNTVLHIIIEGTDTQMVPKQGPGSFLPVPYGSCKVAVDHGQCLPSLLPDQLQQKLFIRKAAFGRELQCPFQLVPVIKQGIHHRSGTIHVQDRRTAGETVGKMLHMASQTGPPRQGAVPCMVTVDPVPVFQTAQSFLQKLFLVRIHRKSKYAAHNPVPLSKQNVIL